MGIFFQNINVSTLFMLAIVVLILVGINEVTRKSKGLSVLVYGVMPIVLLICILCDVVGSPSGKTWFGGVKVISALIGVWGFMAIRYTKLGESRFRIWFPVTILSLNILEAVFKDIQVFQMYKTIEVDAAGILVLGGPWNIMNAVSGILCILILSGFTKISVSKDSSKDMIWPDMTWIYITGYTLWNFTYVYNCISTRSMYAGFAILTSAIIAEYFFKRGAWLQHRAQTLALFGMFSLCVDYQSSEMFQIVANYTPINLTIISGVSMIFNIGAFGYMVYTIIKHNRNPIKQCLYVHTKAYQKNLKANNL